MASDVTYFMRFLGGDFTSSLLSPDFLRSSSVSELSVSELSLLMYLDIVAPGGPKAESLLRVVDVVEKKRKHSNKGAVYCEQKSRQRQPLRDTGTLACLGLRSEVRI